MNISCNTLDQIKITPLLDTLKLEKIDDATYFSEKYSGYISNSRLGLLDSTKGGTPEAFFEGLGKHNIFSTSLSIGSAVHELILQPELFHLCSRVDKPTSKAGTMSDELYNNFINDTLSEEAIIQASNKVDYYKGKLNQDRIEVLLAKCKPYWNQRREYEESLSKSSTPIYLDPRSRETVQQCVIAINQNKHIQSLLHPEGLVTDPISENEKAILLDVAIEVPNYEPFIFKLKSKLDNYTIDQEMKVITVNDIKTIGKILSEFDCKGGNLDKFSYRRELSMYMFLLQLCAQKYYNIENAICKGNFLVVSTIPSYYTKVVAMSKKDFELGFREFKHLLRLAAYYYSLGYRFE